MALSQHPLSDVDERFIAAAADFVIPISERKRKEQGEEDASSSILDEAPRQRAAVPVCPFFPLAP